MKIAGVRFRENWKVYDFDASGVEVSVGDSVIVESDRGLGFARVVRLREADGLPEQTAAEERRRPHQQERPEPEREEEIEIDIDDVAAVSAGGGPPKEQERRTSQGYRRVLRKATEEDLRKEERNRSREGEALDLCRDLILERELPMRLVRAEYSFDGSRVTLYFSSENRVDFRELVKDLAHKLRSRIEMRQIGVRDVARMIGGFGPCGRELCCTSFLKGFEPVSIRMAKKQEMVLNPAKISGICGRLLCCLSYEYAMYDEIKKDRAQMKEAAAKEKQDEQMRRAAEARRDEEEQRAAEARRGQDEERRRQDAKRDRQREKDQKTERPKEQTEERRPEKDRKKDPTAVERDRKQQSDRDRAPAPGPEPRQEENAQKPAGEKGEGKKRRRFWRNRKKKKQGGGSGPAGGGTPAGGA